VPFYTSVVQQRHVKRAAGLLLFLLVLDLSTASFCTAGTFPGGADSVGVVLSASVLAHVEGPLNAEDDGCFCCCTHILPGAHFDLAALEPMIVAASVPGVLDPSGSPLSLFHPPKS
jgi:hypothetical protein